MAEGRLACPKPRCTRMQVLEGPPEATGPNSLLFR